jgi:hypothetical protein
MNELEFDTPVVAHDPGFLLLLLAAAVAMLGVQVALAHARQARRALRRNGTDRGARGLVILPLLLAATGFGAGASSAMVLAISALAPRFDLGYQPLLATALWLVAPLAALPGVALIVWRPLRGSLPLAALALAAAAMAVQIGWLLAPRFEPGLLWQPEWMLVAAAVLVGGMLFALLLAFGVGGSRGAWRRVWRFGAALLGGTGLALGQAAVITGALLSAQTGAAERASVSATTLCTIAGAAVPVLLAALMLWQRIGQAERRLLHRHRAKHRMAEDHAADGSSDPGSTLPPDAPVPALRRRKRQHRHRTL